MDVRTVGYDRDRVARVHRITIPIDGLSSAAAASSVKEAIARLAGVQLVFVDPGTEMAYIVFDGAICNCAHIIYAIEWTGFQAGEPQLRNAQLLLERERDAH